jgi:predicted regulator of Ras-like GTPase activity (Roadblock/LC7/MglB family)
VIPQQAVSPGLQKGKVIFPWAQVRKWMTPPLSGSPSIADDQELVLPLKIIAPAFVAATGATKRREAAEIDQSLPDFFGATPKPAFKLVQEAPEEVPMAKAMTAPPAPAQPAVPEPAAPIAEPAPEIAPAPLRFNIVAEPTAPVAEAAPPVPAEPAAPLAIASPQPATFTPAELVQRTCALPGVAGAVVALEEGLVVAQNLPDGFSADTFAAFMPQIIARLDQSTIEMLLGGTSEITIHTASGPCHIARCGKIYFGTLGHAGENLPDSLRSLTAQLPNLN